MARTSHVLLVIGLLALSGCGPVVYSMNAFPAESSIARATENGAVERAPYQYYSALAYLAKAKEEAGQGQYQDATRFASRADDLAREATAVRRERQESVREGNAQ